MFITQTVSQSRQQTETASPVPWYLAEQVIDAVIAFTPRDPAPRLRVGLRPLYTAAHEDTSSTFQAGSRDLGSLGRGV